MTDVLAITCLVLWIALLGGRGRFWLASVRDSAGRAGEPEHWPSVVAVIPARNEADCIGDSVGSLLRQDYPSEFSIVVVDDDSSDNTGALALRAAHEAGAQTHVTVLRGHGPPPGWTGKLWALKQGIAAVAARPSPPDYLLLTDADIVHAPDTLSWLVGKSATGGFVLTSLMAKLRCTSLAERSHVPAFIYFFQMLFPFAWLCRPETKTAAAAGGCILVRADALRSAGGIDAIRNALIDDCSLAAKLKAVGPIWLGLTERVRSIRPYDTFADVRHMISRSAYAQLRFSPWLLAASTAGMALTFMAPPLLAIFGVGLAQYLGAAVWLAMALSFQPMLRFYRLSPLWGVALPGIALLYMFYTLDSAYRHLRRRGGHWKGRVHVDAPSLQ
jgi:hopene-associated glycosyltransferase HpnB